MELRVLQEALELVETAERQGQQEQAEQAVLMEQVALRVPRVLLALVGQVVLVQQAELRVQAELAVQVLQAVLRELQVQAEQPALVEHQ